jgi:hypothetical protein
MGGWRPRRSKPPHPPPPHKSARRQRETHASSGRSTHAAPETAAPAEAGASANYASAP